MTCLAALVTTLLLFSVADSAIVSILEQGSTFKHPSKGDTVRVHYEGYVSISGHNSTHNGERKFDSSRERDRPFEFVVGKGKVIKCWDRDIAEMFEGSRVMISCPPNEAYGDRGYHGIIPPGATLRFDVKLIDINPPAQLPAEVPKLSASDLEFAARFLKKRR